MSQKEHILTYLTINKDSLFDRFHLVKLALFGSYATDDFNENSDIDILVEFEPKTSNLRARKAELKNLLSAYFNKDVDICRERYIKPYFKEQILSSAIYV